MIVLTLTKKSVYIPYGVQFRILQLAGQNGGSRYSTLAVGK